MDGNGKRNKSYINKRSRTGCSCGAGRSVKEGIATATGKDNFDDRPSDMDSAQTRQRKIGEADSDPSTTGPTENLRQKAARTTNEDDSEEPA